LTGSSVANICYECGHFSSNSEKLGWQLQTAGIGSLVKKYGHCQCWENYRQEMDSENRRYKKLFMATYLQAPITAQNFLEASLLAHPNWAHLDTSRV